MLLFLSKHGVKIAASIVFLAGSLVSGVGLNGLSQAASSEYVLEEVMSECPSQEAKEKIFVDVGGAVSKPGLYALAAGSRVGDAIEEAGGILKTADSAFASAQLNAAKPLKDGDKVFVPLFNEKTAENGIEEHENSNLISINSATVNELMTLPQIGQKRAEDIVAQRPYQSLNELKEKKIVTENVFKDIEEMISL